LVELKWKKSSYSEASGNACVEVAVRDAGIAGIRDSVCPARVLTTSRAALASFVAAIRSGALDTPQG
jgi:hypothetical protein